MRTSSRILSIALIGAILGLAGCDNNEGSLEQAGEKVDSAVQDITQDGALENAGEQADKAWENAKNAAGEAVEKTGEALSGDSQ